MAGRCHVTVQNQLRPAVSNVTKKYYDSGGGIYQPARVVKRKNHPAEPTGCCFNWK